MIKKIIKETYEKSLEKFRIFLTNCRKWSRLDKCQCLSVIGKVIDNNHEKSSWVNIAVLITNVLGFAAYCVISPILAEYRRENGIRIFSMAAIIVIIAIIIWELLCLAGTNRLKKIRTFICNCGNKASLLCKKYFIPIDKVIGVLFAVFIIAIVFVGEWIGRFYIILKNKISGFANRKLLFACGVISVLIGLSCALDVTYCTSIVEIYGMPTKAGRELSKIEDRKKCAAYWKIKDYAWCNYMVLTYMEPYRQLELMKRNSTAYRMSFFQPTACIKIRYKKDRDKYLSLNQSSYEIARNNGFREPIDISYYNSSDKLILKLEKNQYGKFNITRYFSADMPQLLNSTLLYTQNEEIIENSMTSRQIEVTYNSEGLPEMRRLSPYIYNSNGINGEYYVYDKNQRLMTLYYLDINGEFACNKQGIMMIDFQYEDNGNLHCIRYYGGKDRKIKTEGFQGVFCERFSYDSNGNLKERSQRDRNENLRSDKNGVCKYRYSYDYNNDGALEKEEFFGFDGEPVRDNYFHSTFVEFAMSDRIGGREFSVSLDMVGSSAIELNHSEDASIDKEDSLKSDIQDEFIPEDSQQIESEEASGKNSQQNQMVLAPESDRSTKYIEPSKLESRRSDELQYDKQSEQEKNLKNAGRTEIYLDAELDTDIIRNYSAIYYKIGKDGAIREEGFYDSKKNMVECKDGYAKIGYQYDKQKRIDLKKYYDKMGDFICINGGYAMVKYTYQPERDDDIAKMEYLDTEEYLVLNRELGYAYVQYGRIPDDKNKRVYKQYFDENKKPVRLPGLGYSVVEEYYDERNFLIWEAYFDDKNHETFRTDYGVAEIWYEYEDSGNRIRELYKDTEKQLVNRSDTGYAAVYWKYEGGQAVDCHYEGSRNQTLEATVDRTTGIAGIKYTYENGKKVREEYYNTEGEPSFRTDIGCVAQEFEYNDRGKICKKSYYGLDGEAVIRKDTGYAIAEYQDDEYGQRISVRYYGTDKQLVVSAQEHCAGYDYVYDNVGNVKFVKYIGLDGKLMTRRDLGYAQVYYDYDVHGNVLAARYFNKDAELNKNEIFNKNENLAVSKGGGYAYYINEYYDNGKWKSTSYYNEKGEPVLRQDTGYFKIKNEYYEDGKLKSQRFYGTDGKSSVISTKYYCAGFDIEYCKDDFDNGYHFEYEPNEKGIKKTTTYIGLDEKPMIRRDLGYAKVESVYDIGENEVSAIFFDAEGKPTVCKEGRYAAFRNKFKNGNWVRCEYFDQEYKLVLQNDTGYAVIVNEYDEYGQRVKERYYDENGELTISTKYHCAGLAYEYDEKGNKTHVEYLDTEEKIMVRRDLGYAQAAIGYDRVGNKVFEAYFDTKGQPAVCKEGGYASYISEYENVKWMESRYYDKKGRLMLCGDGGYAVIKNQYDAYGQRTAQNYYDASDKPKPIISKEYHCAGFQFEYDELGNKRYAGYLDLDGNLMVRRDLGFAQVEMEYDPIGNKVQEAYYDIWGAPAMDKEGGYSYYKNVYDDKGRLEKVEYRVQEKTGKKTNLAYGQGGHSAKDGMDYIEKIDKEGSLVLRKDTGYAVETYEYDDLGQMKYCLYLGMDEKPVYSTKYYCAGFEYKYDERGNQTDIYYLGTEKEAFVRADLGVSHIQKNYDVYGNIIKEQYFVFNSPVPYQKYGYAAYKEIFENGKVIETQYLDEQGNLAIHGEKGYAMVQYAYDELGQCISEFYYGIDELPVISKNSYCAGILYEYDEVGNQTDRYYVDSDRNYIVRQDLGYAHVHSEYDTYGNETAVCYYDADNEPTTWAGGGNAYCEFIYDKGNCVEWRYFDSQGALMLRSDTGYARIQFEYDAYDQCIGETYYGTEGECIFRKDYQYAGRQFGYDERGNQTEVRYLGLDGGPMMLEELGYAQIKYEFDIFNRKSRETYFDAGGQPVVITEGGYAYCKYDYNDYHDKERWEERQYYDLQDGLMLRNDEGYAIVKYFYNEFRQCTGENYLGLDRQPVMNTKKYCASISYEYDERGVWVKIEYFDENGNYIVPTGMTYATYERDYDALWQVSWEAYYDEDGELIYEE